MKSALLLAFLLIPGSAWSQDVGTISGRITDTATGEGLSGVLVQLQGAGLIDSTGIDGAFSFWGAPAGVYTLRASLSGYTARSIPDVSIVAGHIREIDVALSPGTGEVASDQDMPVALKDVIGIPKIFGRHDMLSAPVRGPAELAKIQPGIVSYEGFRDLFVRGGRSGETAYYVDGVRISADAAARIPQAALEQQVMLTGYLPARYGDAMSAVVNLTTRSDRRQLFGSLEGLTSDRLDPYGYNVVSGAAGGPIVSNRLSFLASGEYIDRFDASPRSAGQLTVDPDVLDHLRAFPMSFRATNAAGDEIYLPIPAGLTDGATLSMGVDGLPLISDGRLTFSDGTTIEAGGVDPSSIRLSPVYSAQYIPEDALRVERARRENRYRNLALLGHLSWDVFPRGRLRVGGFLNQGEWDAPDENSDRRILFVPEMTRRTERDAYHVYGAWMQRIEDNALFRFQADYSDVSHETFDPRFGRDWNALLDYGDIDHSAFETLRGYKSMYIAQVQVGVDDRGTPDDSSDDLPILINAPNYRTIYQDGSGPDASDKFISSLVQIPGGRFNQYERGRREQLRLSGYIAGRIGPHRLELGGEFERQTHRFWQIDAWQLARFAADGNPEQIVPGDPNLNPEGYSTYEDIPLHVLENFVGSYYGYDLRGQNEVDTEDFSAFLNRRSDKPLEDYNLTPYEPRYYGGYLQDKIELGRIVIEAGLRVDVFDNNARVLKDPFSRRPVCRAGDVGSAVNGIDCGAGVIPSNVGADFAVFYNGDRIVGFRDTRGNFYDGNGQPSAPIDILLPGSTRLTHATIIEEMFADYAPQVSVLPRIGLTLPASDRTVLFLALGVTSQRPGPAAPATLADYRGFGDMNNSGLKPERTKKFELGVHQRFGDRSSISFSAFYHKIENLTRIKDLLGATPRIYLSFTNEDIARVKGLEMDFRMRSRNGFSINGNYTFTFAEGTGSNSSFGSDIFLGSTSPELYNPLDFDRRHNLNLLVNYRPGAGEGARLFGIDVFRNFEMSLLARTGSGFPYTPVQEVYNLAGDVRSNSPRGGINDTRMPWSSRIDLRIDRRFPFSSRASVSAFFWVQNLFDQTTILNVWPYSGLHDDDGFLSTPSGAGFLANRPPLTETLYRHRTRIPTWTGIPRMMRLGLRLDF